jgi:hypothetical protein
MKERHHRMHEPTINKEPIWQRKDQEKHLVKLLARAKNALLLVVLEKLLVDSP